MILSRSISASSLFTLFICPYNYLYILDYLPVCQIVYLSINIDPLSLLTLSICPCIFLLSFSLSIFCQYIHPFLSLSQFSLSLSLRLTYLFIFDQFLPVYSLPIHLSPPLPLSLSFCGYVFIYSPIFIYIYLSIFFIILQFIENSNAKYDHLTK